MISFNLLRLIIDLQLIFLCLKHLSRLIQAILFLLDLFSLSLTWSLLIDLFSCSWLLLLLTLDLLLLSHHISLLLLLFTCFLIWRLCSSLAQIK